MNCEKVPVHANGGLSTLRCLNNFKKFNYIKIYKTTVLKSGPNTSKFFYLFQRLEFQIPSVPRPPLAYSLSYSKSFMTKFFFVWKNNCLN